ncbi:flagellar assembly protein FliW [Acidithiobacillus sulfuriphilus]|uniref:flagellar assembly protein FliW n=1 Tax=Acidithiobacillus sulfuriphilus TaxID=1867749 RepID=UPI003F632255
MSMQATRFGPLDIDDEQIWTCAAPMPGFEDLRRFALLHVADQGPFLWLQSLEEPLISFLLVEGRHFALDYTGRPPFLRAEGSCITLVMVILPRQPEEGLQANALAPLCFQPESRRFGQWIVDTQQSGTATPPVHGNTPPLALAGHILHLIAQPLNPSSQVTAGAA